VGALLVFPSPNDGRSAGEDDVANIKSQIKRNRQNERLRLSNKAVRSEMKTRTKNAVVAVGTEDETAALRLAIKRIDKAAAAGVIHKNQAANRKSRLMRRVNTLKASA
jgi:small subunit ribosomal protein S20